MYNCLKADNYMQNVVYQMSVTSLLFATHLVIYMYLHAIINSSHYFDSFYYKLLWSWIKFYHLRPKCCLSQGLSIIYVFWRTMKVQWQLRIDAQAIRWILTNSKWVRFIQLHSFIPSQRGASVKIHVVAMPRAKLTQLPCMFLCILNLGFESDQGSNVNCWKARFGIWEPLS